MAAQELRWLSYMLTDLGEQPRSPPVLYVDNKAMLALCREHRLEHRTKHIALRYFLARELQQRGQLRLAYVASQANTADVFTKALPPGDHQRFCTMLGFPTCADPVVIPSRRCPADVPSPALTPPSSRPGVARRPIRGPALAARCGPALLPPQSRPLPCSRPVAALPYCCPSRGSSLQPPLTRAAPPATAPHRQLPSCSAMPRCTACCCAAPPGTKPRRPAQPRRTAEPRCPSAFTASAATAATAPTAATAATMASPTVLSFDAEGRAMTLTCGLTTCSSFFYVTLRMGWTIRVAVARLAVRNHLPSAERAHFGQYKTAQSLYDAVVARYSSPATAAISRLMLPYLFPDLAAFATVADLITHLRTSDARYRAALPTEDHFLSLCPTELTLDLLEERLTAAEKSILAVGTAPAGARGARVVEGTVGAAKEAVEEAEGVAVEVGVVEAAAAAVEAAAVVVEVAAAVVLVEVQPRKMEALVVASASSSRVPLPRWGDLLKQNVAIFDLDFDAILAAMYAVTDSAEGTGESAAPGAGESALSSTAPTEALHTFTLDSGALHYFFRDSTTLMPLSWLVAIALADPSGGPVLAHSSMVLPCPAAPLGLLSGLHLPSFSTNLVSGAHLQDAWVYHFTPGGQRVTHCTCSWMGRHLATFTCRAGSSLYTLTTESPPVAASGQVAASGKVFAAASRSSPMSAPCYVSSSVIRDSPLAPPPWSPLPASSSRYGLPCPCLKSPPVPPSPSSGACPYLYSYMDVWGRARVREQGHERYFLLVVDDYSRYTIVFPLHSKVEVSEVLINWIRGACRQLSERFGSDLPVLRLHSDRGGELSSDLLSAFFRAEGIHQTFTLPASPQQNGIAERRIGMVMDVARTSMIYAAASHFLWPFAVQYAAHQINLQPRVSLLETTPTLRWTGKVGDATVFFFWGSRDFVRDTSADKLSSRAGSAPSGVSQVDPVELVEVAVDSGAANGAEPAGPGSGGVWPKVSVSEGAGPERVESGGAEPGGAEFGSAEPWGAEPERAESRGPPGVPSQREPLSLQRLREWYTLRCHRAAGAGAAGGAFGAAGATGGAARAGAAGGAAGAGAARGAGAAGPGGTRTGGTGATGAGGASIVGAAGAGAVEVTGAGGAAGVVNGDPGVEGTGAVSAVSGGVARPWLYYFPLLEQVLGPSPLLSPPPVQSQSQLQPASPLPGPSPYSGLTRGLTERRAPESRPALPISCPASPESRRDLPVRTSRRVPRQRPPPVPGTHYMTLRPSTPLQPVPLPSPLASSLPDGPDPESISLRAASPTVMRFLAFAVTDPLFESTAASALVTELVDFAAACRLEYATSLVAESASESVCPLSVGGECALGTDVLEDRKEEFECFATAVPHLVSMLLAPKGDPDAPDIPTPRSYAEAIEGPYSSQVKRPPDSPPAFKARYVARGFSQQQGVDFFQTFSPTPKISTLRWHDTQRTTLAALGFAPSTVDPSLFLRTDTTQLPFYVLVYVDDLVFATADTEALAHVKSELQKRHTCIDLGELTSYLGLRITRDRAQHTITFTQSHMVQQVLQRFGFTYSLRQSTPLPTGPSLSAPPSDESVEPSGPVRELVRCLMYLMTRTRLDLAYPLSILARYVAPGRHQKVHWDAAKRVLRYLCSTSGMGLVLGGWARVVLTGHADASWVDDLAMQRPSQGYTFSLGSGSVSWRSTRSSSVLSSRCEAEIYAEAMAAQELRWLTYLLTDLGEAPRSPPVLYVDNKAILALCQEHRLEH
ncbi:unnamed protein product [Closterium sp. NIES-54]